MKDKNQIDSAEYISLEEAKRIKLPFFDGLAAVFLHLQRTINTKV